MFGIAFGDKKTVQKALQIWPDIFSQVNAPDHIKCISPKHKKDHNKMTFPFKSIFRRIGNVQKRKTDSLRANPFKHCCGLHLNSVQDSILPISDVSIHQSLPSILPFACFKVPLSVFIARMTEVIKIWLLWKVSVFAFQIALSVCVLVNDSCGCGCVCVCPLHPCLCNPLN